MDAPVPKSDVHSTLSFIEDLGLPHPGGALLASFVIEALHPEMAAGFVRSRATSEGEARLLVADWIHAIECVTNKGTLPNPLDAETTKSITQRDGKRCCVTGRPGSFFDPLTVAPVLPIPSGWLGDDRIRKLIGVFFGAPYRDWWFDYARHPMFTPPSHNHWLVRKSVSDALRRGLIKLVRRPSSPIEFEVSNVAIGAEQPIKINGAFALLGDYSRTGIDKVDARFVGSHGRFCKSIQLVAVAREIAPELFSREPSAVVTDPAPKAAVVPSTLPSYFHWPGRSFHGTVGLALSPFSMLWTLFPARPRMSVYGMLRKLGRRVYGPPNGTENVQKLPFGLYLKFDADSLQNEYNALRVVRRNTTIPVPKALDVVHRPAKADDPFSTSEGYLLMTKIPGVTLAQSQDALSDADCANIALQLREYVAQLRHLPRQAGSENSICNTVGEACRDPRIRGGDAVGPFENETEFNQVVRFSDDPARQGHKVLFTHADLNPRNILVERATSRLDRRGYWRISGILDWETAGYYPEYWDYTKSMHESVRWPRRYNNLVKEAFGPFGDYSRELDVETRSRESGDGF